MKQLNFLSGLKQIRVALVLSILCLLSISKESQAQDGTSMYDAIYAGYYSSSGSSPFSDWRNNYYYGGTYYSDNYYYNPSPDVWYYIDVYDYTSLKISLCGSDFDTYLHLLDQYGNEVTSNDDSYECGSQSVIEYNNLPAGSYYIVVEGSGYADGNFSLDIQPLACNSSPSAGANISNAITAGTFSASGNYTDTRSNVDACLGDDIGQTSNDIYYQFTLNSTATVSLSHCGSGFDTYMWLLDAWGNTITYNDDNSSSPCPGTQSYIQTTLSAGTYYVVSEGYSSNTGNIATSIEVNMSSPMTITYAGSSQTYVQGTPITPLTPTVTGGTPSSGGQTTISLAGNGIAGSQNGTGAAARFDWPLGTAVDASGNVYVADSENEMVRKITPEGVVTTFAGNGTRGATNGTGTGATFRHPAALAVDASGNIYVGDQQNHMIRKITPAGVVTTFAGSGAAGSSDGTSTSATFNNPIGLAFDQSGNLYVADYANHKIRKITPSGVVSTYAGTGSIGATNGAAASATFKNPMSVAVDASGNVYVGDRMNYMVRKITAGGVVSTLAGSGSAGSADGTGTSASFNVPNSVAVDGSGNVYVADQLNNKIRKISPSGLVSTFAGAVTSGNTDGTGSAVRFNNPFGLCIDSQENLYIADYHNHKIRKMMTRAFVISPDLPAGLVFNSSNGTISGTPAVASAATNYTIYAQSAASSTSPPFTMNITVQAGSSNCTGSPLNTLPSQNQNYIVENIIKVPYITNISQIAGKKSCEVNQTVKYFDGLGRPMQVVQVMGSASEKDIVQPIVYDAYGREEYKYQPYADANSSNGSFKSNALTDQAFYYSTSNIWDGHIKKTGTPYSKTVFEPSPLNRVVEQGAPGDDWQPVTGSTAGHTLKTIYAANSAVDAVKLWIVNSGGASSTTDYAVNQLYKTISKDENWEDAKGKAGTTEEFKDKEGKVVLKRTWETNTKSLSTYYVYDDLGNLRYVLPPGVNENGLAISTFTDGDTNFNEFIYGYKYDHRNRLTEKKIPGKGWEYTVYNKLDQVVMSQDVNQRDHANQEWIITKYDAFGRVALTALYIHFGSTANTSYRDHFQGQVNAQTTHWETPTTTGTGYTANTYPTTWNQELTINYYDNYAIPSPAFAISVPAGALTTPKGLLTGSLVNILGSSTMLLTVNYYDAKGRVIKTKSKNHLDGTDETTNVWSFDGRLESSIRTHLVNSATTTIASYPTYDHMGRIKSSNQDINTGTPEQLSSNTYNEIGQLNTKSLGNSLQSTEYTYNERGWLKSMDASDAQFSMTLNYNDAVNNMIPQYNGNIANQVFANGTSSNTFNYKYDELNRLENGSTHTTGMSEALTYDVMGNINTLSRDGGGVNQYTYDGNRLKSVAGVTLVDYEYDPNGNATKDGRLNKTLTYNLLNLPKTVNTNEAVYVYDATGRKLKKTSVNSITSVITITDYVDRIQYTNGIIDFIQTEEGLARNSGGTYSYEYNLKDHLGNIRVTFYNYSGLDIEQRDNYYAFGKQKEVIVGTNKYLYNGKEKQEDLGDQLDYGARFYDPVIGRFTTVDPLSEKRNWLTPYNYVQNNPIIRNDPTGALDDYIFDETGEYKRVERNDKPDKLVVENSKTGSRQSYNFADPESDTKDIENGTITRVTFVSTKKMTDMLGKAGALSETNRDNKWSFMNRESKGGQDLDFSYTTLPNEFGNVGASKDPLTTPASTLFIPEGDGYAHNQMNFGNYLWGAAGYSLGFSEPLLRGAAHYNSVANSATNGYRPQLDSSDDQLSIGRGINFSQSQLLRYRTWTPNVGVSSVNVPR